MSGSLALRGGAFALAALLLGFAAVRNAPGKAVWVPSMPPLRQEVPYSCGAAALRMVFARYRQFWAEPPLREALGSAESHGTSHQRMVSFARSQGLDAEFHEYATAESLRTAVRRRQPTIVALQAWGDGATYREAGSGHYAVVAGYRGDRFFFLDPWDGAIHELTESELVERWHDVDSEGIPVRQLALFFRESHALAPMAFEKMP